MIICLFIELDEFGLSREQIVEEIRRNLPVKGVYDATATQGLDQTGLTLEDIEMTLEGK